MPKDGERSPAIYSGPGKRCGLYRAGHEVHWIQAKKSWEEPGLVEDGDVTHVAFGLIKVSVGSGEREYWNHDTTRLRELLKWRGKRVVIQERWGLLKVPSPDGFFCFCIAKSRESWVKCQRGSNEG